MREIGLVLVGAILLVGCGAGPGASLEGREFLSTSVTEDGVNRPLVADTQIRLSFRDGQIGASAGCNSIGGTYRLEGDRLVFEGGGMTEMGCDDERHAQDDWLAEFLGSGPVVSLVGSELRLTSDGTVIALQDSEVAEPDLPLVGTVWTVDSIFSGDTAMSVADAVATFEFSDDGRVEVQTGCNEGSGRYEITDGSLRFIDVVVTERACDGAAGAMEAAVLPVLGAESLTWAIDTGNLTIMAGENGLGLRGS